MLPLLAMKTYFLRRKIHLQLLKDTLVYNRFVILPYFSIFSSFWKTYLTKSLKVVYEFVWCHLLKLVFLHPFLSIFAIIFYVKKGFFLMYLSTFINSLRLLTTFYDFSMHPYQNRSNFFRFFVKIIQKTFLMYLSRLLRLLTTFNDSCLCYFIPFFCLS